MAIPSGIPALGDLPTSAHVGHFYWDQADLLDTLVPFFTTGLREGDRCIWVCSQPLCAAEARSALEASVPHLADRERAGQIDILDHHDWYTRQGTLTPEQVIDGWLRAEDEALAAGYRGLRINGNTYWLEPEQWSAFADYEARVHDAFRGRKIIALCSYPLSKCGSHEVVDVMHNHGASLVRGSRGWDVVHGATAALASVDAGRYGATPPHAHAVEMYPGDLPADRVADRLAAALHAGRGAVAIVTRDHGARVAEHLEKQRIDVMAQTRAGRLAILDADELFAAAWSRPGVRTDVIAERVGTVIARIVERHSRCTVFGNLLDLFARARDREAAIELEKWWNEQLATSPIEVICGYSLSSFDDSAGVAAFRQVCDAHREVATIGAEATDDVDRLRVELAQVTSALEQEMTRRELVEAAFASARDAREHLVLLNRLTAALGEVTTRAQLVELVRDLVAKALGAPGIAIVERDSPGDALLAEGLAPLALREAATLPVVRALWSRDTTQLAHAGRELGGFAVVPVAIGSRRLATLVLGFADKRPFSAPFRALAEDIARQLALALDRAISYERLEQERERAESASRAKDEFLAMLGHELRNPLSPILTATQLMRLRGEEVFDKERTVIERQCRHMIRLVDDLLDVSRITRGKVELRRRPLEVSEVIAQAVELVSPALEERAHRLTLDVPTAGTVVHVDPQRLAQVLANLLTNAAKYTPHGGAIHVAAHGHDSSVTISVRDSGIGIDPKLLPHVFDLFVQGRQGIDRAAGGLGLGLAIARTLVETHGGRIEARSAGAGQGSEFIVELPRYANTRPSTRNMTSGAFRLAVARAYQVLVVDDNEDAAFLFSEALKGLGHRVEVAHDGPSALVVARQRPPEICFLDIGLPVMDGYELGRRLRESLCDRDAVPKLVAVTGYGHTSDRVRSREAGFDLHLVKPVDLNAIQDALAKLAI
jgi:signal transduction histidine kinase